MITFYLVRHGAKEAVPLDPPLTVTGLKQAEATAQYLSNILFKAIIASPKLRTLQTAQIIARRQSLQVLTDKRLIERMEWENNESFIDFIAEWRKTDIDRNYYSKTGDSSVNKGKMMKEVLKELSDTYQDGNILIVTHGGAIGDLLRTILGNTTVPHLIDPVTGAPHIQISECSITIVENNNDRYTLIRLNSISHF